MVCCTDGSFGELYRGFFGNVVLAEEHVPW